MSWYNTPLEAIIMYGQLMETHFKVYALSHQQFYSEQTPLHTAKFD